MEPVSNKKALKDWDFEDLKSWAVWNVISGITRGHSLSGCMHEVLSAALEWAAERNIAAAVKRERKVRKSAG